MSKKIRKRIYAAAFILILAAVTGIIIWNYHKESVRKSLVYCQEYNTNNPAIKGDLDVKYFTDISDKFDIGANAEGYAVFKNPEAAFEELKARYADGIALIQREYNLESLSQDTYGFYDTYGWQVTLGTEEEKKQAYFVSGFMDIYENSFIGH